MFIVCGKHKTLPKNKHEKLFQAELQNTIAHNFILSLHATAIIILEPINLVVLTTCHSFHKSNVRKWRLRRYKAFTQIAWFTLNFNNALAISRLQPRLYIATNHEIGEGIMFAWPCNFYAVDAEHFWWSTHHAIGTADANWFLCFVYIRQWNTILQLWQMVTGNIDHCGDQRLIQTGRRCM